MTIKQDNLHFSPIGEVTFAAVVVPVQKAKFDAKGNRTLTGEFEYSVRMTFTDEAEGAAEFKELLEAHNSGAISRISTKGLPAGQFRVSFKTNAEFKTHTGGSVPNHVKVIDASGTELMGEEVPEMRADLGDKTLGRVMFTIRGSYVNLYGLQILSHEGAARTVDASVDQAAIDAAMQQLTK